MLIDWFTVGAQVLNFLILVWLLKRFLYRPILDAVDARERKIAAALAEADAQKAQAAAEREAFRNKNAEFDKARAALFDEAGRDAAAERQRLLDEARREAADFAARRREALLGEARALHREIGLRTRQEVFAIARKTLGDLAGETLEARMVESFIGRLRALDEAERQGLRRALLLAGQALTVRSTCQLPAAAGERLAAAIRETLGGDVAIRMEIAPELVSGIELSTDGHKLAWSIAEYLAELEKGVGDLLKAREDAAAGGGQRREGGDGS